MSYGIPCMGSKQKIVKELCRIFPKSDNFYDLFGGGFSVTHFMIENRSKDFKEFHFNEIRKGMPELIKKCINGDFAYDKYKMPFVTREEFFEKKDSDLFIKIIWSFGNSGESYLFGKEIEKQEESLHNAIVFDDFDDYAKKIFGITKFKEGHSITEKRLYLRSRLNSLTESRRDLQQLERLEQLQQLERLQQLQQLQQLHFYNSSYKDVQIKENSLIYCDIPYLGTGEYDKNKSFRHDEFYDWASSIGHPVFVPEYTLPDKRFIKVWSKNVRSTMSATSNNTQAVECLFANKEALKMLSKRS